jgi:hypothetical protein
VSTFQVLQKVALKQTQWSSLSTTFVTVRTFGAPFWSCQHV